MRLHAACAALDDDAVLLLGPSGSGKSDLLLRLLDRGFDLIGDDQVEVVDGRVRPCGSIAGLIELRGVGLFRTAYRHSAKLRLIVHMASPTERLPTSVAADPRLGAPTISLNPAEPGAAIRVHWALDAACGRRMQHCGALFA